MNLSLERGLQAASATAKATLHERTKPHGR
jgi:hypothetical protein